MKARLLTFTASALVLGALTTACGSSPSEPTAPEAASTHSTTHATATPVARKVDPRRNGLEIAMGEWAVQMEATVIRPGPVTVVVSNRGTVGHGFEIEAEGVDSSGHGGGDDRHKVESRVLAPGETIRIKLNLPAGLYKVECLVDGHDDMGMETMLEVRKGAPLVKEKTAAKKQNAVSISGFAYQPAQITVKAGQAVTWTNDDPADHTVTHEGGDFASETLGQGARFRMVFDRPGTYRYVCALHPEMKGTVVVK